jgi:putative tricarboxylic transport membrane protein
VRRSLAEILLSVGVLAMGAGVAAVTATLPSEGGYAGIGPNFVPGFVAAGLIALGLWLAAEAFSGGWREMPPADPAERGEHAFDRAGFGWVSAGLFAHMALIGIAGFVVAGTVLFLCVARGFGSTRFSRDAALGIVMTLVIYLFFVKLLNVNLPAGWLSPVLGGAGI